MAGVTLSVEEIHAAPPEVRRWLEQEIVRALGMHPLQEHPTEPAAPPLTGSKRIPRTTIPAMWTSG